MTFLALSFILATTYPYLAYGETQNRQGLQENTGQSNNQGQPKITLLKAAKNDYIYGKVEGLNPKTYKDHKVLVYRLTDQWYIHPL
jgi:hypothetical protein